MWQISYCNDLPFLNTVIILFLWTIPHHLNLKHKVMSFYLHLIPCFAEILQWKLLTSQKRWLFPGLVTHPHTPEKNFSLFLSNPSLDLLVNISRIFFVAIISLNKKTSWVYILGWNNIILIQFICLQNKNVGKNDYIVCASILFRLSNVLLLHIVLCMKW